MSDRPNILIIMADQLAPQFTGTYGHPLVQTPHLDALAARGMRFDAAYCNSPLCAPSRAAFMSGQAVSRTGVYDNAAEFPASIPTFAHYLTGAGYRTCLSGRMHFVGPDQKHGFAERLTTDIYPADFAWTPDWTRPEERIDSWYHNMGPIKEAGTAHATFLTDYDDEVAFAARRWLMDRARDRAAGEAAPFCLVTSFFHPHDPYVARHAFWDLYDDIPLPESPPATDPMSRRLMDGIEASTTPVTPEEVRRARRAYFANVSYIDAKIGELIQTLTETDALDNTVVIVTSDHGDMLGERCLWFKMSYFEHSVRVPLVMAGPGIATGTAPNACSLIDLAPTLMDLAEAGDPRVPLDGRSLMPLARGEQDDTSEVIAEYCAEMTGAPVFMIRRGAMKYIHCDTDPPQLYDLDADPDELTNVATDPAYAAQAVAFADEVAQRWDSAALQRDVIASQQARFAVHKGMAAAGPTQWDHSPQSDATRQYVRSHMDWAVADRRYRYPPLP
ncbi:MAG: choline-sulfatase [Pseudomonadota bacterium]